MAKQKIKIKTASQMRQELDQQRREEAKTTKFKITMTIEVENSSVMSKMTGCLHDAIKEAIEGLGSGDSIKVIEANIL